MQKTFCFTLLALLVSAVALAQEPAQETPRPPESFCGFTFGEVYTNASTVALTKPFRYCTQAEIRTTANEHRIYRVLINGVTPDSMSEEDKNTEWARMREIVEKKLGVKIEKHGKYYGYDSKKFSVTTACWHTEKGNVIFNVVVTRRDIQEADKNAARKKNIQPLPPDAGGDAL